MENALFGFLVTTAVAMTFMWWRAERRVQNLKEGESLKVFEFAAHANLIVPMTFGGSGHSAPCVIVFEHTHHHFCVFHAGAFLESRMIEQHRQRVVLVGDLEEAQTHFFMVTKPGVACRVFVGTLDDFNNSDFTMDAATV